MNFRIQLVFVTIVSSLLLDFLSVKKKKIKHLTSSLNTVLTTECCFWTIRTCATFSTEIPSAAISRWLFHVHTL